MGRAFHLADFLEAVRERELVETLDWESGEESDPVFQVAERKVERALLFNVDALDRRRVFDSPMCGHGLPRPHGASLARRVVTDGEHEIHLRSIGGCEFLPVFRAHPLGWIAIIFERLDGEGIDRALRMAARREGLESSRAVLAKDAFRKDRT